MEKSITKYEADFHPKLLYQCCTSRENRIRIWPITVQFWYFCPQNQPVFKDLLTGTVPIDKEKLATSIPVNKELLTRSGIIDQKVFGL